MTDDNPIITCTILQLAFCAWQIKRNGYDASTIDFAETGPSWVAFRKWWDVATVAGAASIRDVCWRAWIASAPVDEPNHDEAYAFVKWWDTIVAGQPRLMPMSALSRSASTLAAGSPSIAPIAEAHADLRARHLHAFPNDAITCVCGTRIDELG